MATLSTFDSPPRAASNSPLLKLKQLHLNKASHAASLIKDKVFYPACLVTMQGAMNNPFDVMTYLRPSNQLVLLLQKGTDFPVYPPELAQCIDEKTWYNRMEDLEKALTRYWSWVEKALFAFAFIASVTIPWPVISAVSRMIHTDDDDEWVLVEDDYDSETASSAAAAAATTAIRSAGAAASETLASVTSAATAMATKFVRRQAEINSTDSDEFISTEYDDEELWPGYSSWDDGYSSDLRWAAIGILIGVVIAVWLPWFIVTIRNSRRLRDLVERWNFEDTELGPMRALTWSLDKAPAFSNAKFLIIGLPPSLTQSSIFNTNAYPPLYTHASQIHTQGNALPDYHDQGHQGQFDEKTDWYAPPQPIAEQKVHVASGGNVARDSDDGLQRINSARHSLSHARRESLASNSIYESEKDAVSIAYGADPVQPISYGHQRRASDTASVHSFHSRRGSVADDLDGGPARPERSSSRSASVSGRVL